MWFVRDTYMQTEVTVVKNLDLRLSGSINDFLQEYNMGYVVLFP